MNTRVLILLSVLLLMVVPAVSLAGPPYPTVFSTQASYPEVYTNENYTIYLNSTYGFDTYNSILIFSGENLSGMSNTFTLQSNSSKPDTVVYVTAPSTPQTITVFLESYGIGNGTFRSYRSTFSIQVVSPIVMNATITNPSASTMNNVTVTFAINGNNVSTLKIATILPYQSKTVSTKVPYIYLLNRGTNTETVYVSNPEASINGRGSEYSIPFHYGPNPNYFWIYYVAAVVVVFMLFLVISSGRRLPARRPKWKKK